MARVSCSVPKLSLWQRCLRARLTEYRIFLPKNARHLHVAVSWVLGEGWLALLESDKTPSDTGYSIGLF